MKSVYIYHHLGLGDHIIANGMVRTIAKKYDRVYLFCLPHNFLNVSFMYRDLKHLKIITLTDDEVKTFMVINPKENYIVAGHDEFIKIYEKDPNNTLKIDEIFYKLAKIPLENKWKEFFIKRDLKREKEVFKELGLDKGEKYVFIHDKPDRKITKNIPNLKIIRPNNLEFSIFDFLYTIEKAYEIHCINSSFACLIDCIGIKQENMNIHIHIPSDLKALNTLNSNWKIIT